MGAKLYYREVGEGVRQLKEGRYIGHHGRTGSFCVIAADGVKRGTGVRRLAGWATVGHATCRSGWRSRCLGWRDKDGSATGSSCHAPPMQTRIYIRKADVEEYTPTDSCPGCTRILLGQSTVLPHTEACRARIVTLMQQAEEGKSRLEELERKRRPKGEERSDAPERDVPADDAAGAPADKAVQASEERRGEGN